MLKINGKKYFLIIALLFSLLDTNITNNIELLDNKQIDSINKTVNTKRNENV
jgi:hypothetical protein